MLCLYTTVSLGQGRYLLYLPADTGGTKRLFTVEITEVAFCVALWARQFLDPA